MESTQKTANKSILIVDDDKLVLQSLSTVFIKQGWNVDICQHSTEALSRVEQRKYGCILMDIRMPELDGTQVMEQLKKLVTEGRIEPQKVIFMTGFADEPATIKAFQLGADHYIHKPFDIALVLQKATACIESRDFMTELEAEQVTEDDTKQFKKIRKSYQFADINTKSDILARKLGISLRHIKGCTYDTASFQGNIENPIGIIQIPLGIIGPVPVNGGHANGEFYVPMATTEGALLLTYDLGSRLASMSGGINVEIISKSVHVTPMFPIHDDEDVRIKQFVDENYDRIKEVAEGGSNHTKLLAIEKKRVKNNFLLRFSYDTGDAQGLNMINHASFNAAKYIESKTGATFYHRSHYSGVKHHSPLNEEIGYGRSVKATALITSKALGMLKVTATEMKDFFDRCVECGNEAGILSVNVHAANAIAAIFLATGQDAADVSSAHACATRTHLANNGKDLQIDCHLKNLLIATVGGGTGLGTQAECLSIMDCLGSGKADKFAEIIAACVLAGEFPTAAAVINRSYVDIHNKYGRNKSKLIRD